MVAPATAPGAAGMGAGPDCGVGPMYFRLSPELLALRQRLRDFCDEAIRPLELRYMADGALPAEETAALIQRVKAAGLWMLDVPTAHGGQGWGLLGACLLAEETQHWKVLPYRHNEVFGPRVGPILYALDPAQQQQYLWPVLRGDKHSCFAQTEPGAGSDPARITTRAVSDGDDLVLSGVKRFIGHADRADFAQVICRTGPDRDAGALSCLLVDMDSPGVELVRPWRTMMGDTPWEIRFERVRVPRANLVGMQGEGFGLAQTWITRGRICNHGARCVGIARRALGMLLDHAASRETFGQRLADRQAVQFMVADSAIELRQAELLVYETAWRHEVGEDVHDQSYMVKIAATEMASRVVDRAMQVHGGLGLTVDLPLEYWYRQLRSIRITEGATEVLRWRLARNLFRAEGDGA